REVISNAFFNSIDVSFCRLSTKRPFASFQFPTVSLLLLSNIIHTLRTSVHDRNNHDDMMWSRDTNEIITRMLIVLWSVILSTSFCRVVFARNILLSL